MTPVSYPNQPIKESHQDSSSQIQPFPPPLYPGSMQIQPFPPPLYPGPMPILPYHRQTQLPPIPPFILGSLSNFSPPAPSGQPMQSYSDLVPKDSNMVYVEAIYRLLRQLFGHTAVDGLDLGNFLQFLNAHPDLNAQLRGLERSESSPETLTQPNPQTSPSSTFYLEPNSPEPRMHRTGRKGRCQCDQCRKAKRGWECIPDGNDLRHRCTRCVQRELICSPRRWGKEKERKAAENRHALLANRTQSQARIFKPFEGNATEREIARSAEETVATLSERFSTFSPSTIVSFTDEIAREDNRFRDEFTLLGDPFSSIE